MLEFVQDVSCSSSCLRLFFIVVKLSSLGSFHSGCFLSFCKLYVSFKLSTCGLGSFSVIVGCIVLLMFLRLLTSLGCFRKLTLFGLFQFDFKLSFF